ncbi:tRNA (adenosine(37)-N6)-dimethylallyltransferase MiaA [Candidatus Saccharibacteria bacterium]|nr:tRNA (adenosine(37)-N6)-dimethylallyltransferase MiaA [Candidatus Saccharibacteria bacterium]
MRIIPVIVGPTGSGKTGVGIEVAKAIEQKFGKRAEIISADSRTIYRGFDVGTAKPTIAEREGVTHFGFDLVEADERFTVSDWKKYAEEKILEIEERGNIPIVVGGTGLYVDALIFDYKFNSSTNKLNKEGNKIVHGDSTEYPDREKMCSKYKVFGIFWERDELRERLRKRADKMFNQELYDETERLVRKYGWENQAMKSDVYQFAWEYMQGRKSREESVELAAIDDWHLARRQLTWFKRNEKILWLPLEKIKPAVIKCIQDEQGK